ncbi:MAG: hypothetical protein OXE79_00750 [Acidimicrobiaceae bacterium]|nr:hypothetical protein [Acidimicrobiaceae bacterium]MCY4280630.1 hypothetical protein [Acidimicrobiaceae bacterium]MCY4293406.1 hypothetical protein [Acidimicrobiaceae bacterium]
MTLIALTVLVAAWLGYFAMCIRDRRESRSARIDGMIDASQYSQYLDLPFRSVNHVREAPASSAGALEAVGALGADRLSLDDPASRSVGDLLEAPRTPQQALRRRRHIVAWLVAAAVLSLMSVPSLGDAALAMHVTVDVVLILFLFGLAQRQHAPAENLAEVRVLYPRQPALDGTVDVPQRRVVNG